jgi:hypothetical protein
MNTKHQWLWHITSYTMRNEVYASWQQCNCLVMGFGDGTYITVVMMILMIFGVWASCIVFFLKRTFREVYLFLPLFQLDGQLTHRVWQKGLLISHVGCSVPKNSLPVGPRWVSTFPPFCLWMGTDIFSKTLFFNEKQWTSSKSGVMLIAIQPHCKLID